MVLLNHLQDLGNHLNQLAVEQKRNVSVSIDTGEERDNEPHNPREKEERSANSPKLALKDNRVLSSHLSGEFRLVVVHEIGIGDNDQGDFRLQSVGNGAGS